VGLGGTLYITPFEHTSDVKVAKKVADVSPSDQHVEKGAF